MLVFIFQNDFLLEQAKGYVKALEKSTSRVLGLREVFEHCGENDKADGESLKVVLKNLPSVRSGEFDRTRTRTIAVVKRLYSRAIFRSFNLTPYQVASH